MGDNKKSTLNNVSKYTKEATVILTTFLALNAEISNAQNLQEDNNSRKAKLEIAKKKSSNIKIDTLIKDGKYSEAYDASFDHSKQGILKSDEVEEYVETIKEDIEELNEKDVEKYFEKNPDAKEFLKSLDKDNHFLNSLENKKYKDIQDIIENTYVRTDTLEYKPGMNIKSMGEYNSFDNQINRTVFKVDTTKYNITNIPEKEKNILVANDYEFIGSVIAHELGHKKNDEGGIEDHEYRMEGDTEVLDISIKDKDKLNQADEISAEMNAMIYFHERYKETGKVSNAMQARFPDYARAIKEGIINPNSQDQKEQEKEMALIAKIATRDWQKTRKEKYTGNMAQKNAEYADFILTDRIHKTEGKSTIREESILLVFNKKIQNCFTFYFNGEKRDFSKFINMDEIKPYKNTKTLSENFYKNVNDLQEAYKIENSSKKNKTFDATNMFVKEKE